MKKLLENPMLFDVLLIVVMLLFVFNQYLLLTLTSGSSYSTSTSLTVGGDVQSIIDAIIPHGVPLYGSELGVSFEDPINGLNKLAALDRSVGFNSLTDEEKTRYLTNISPKATCEYCCGANSLSFSNGRPACGCSHSAAMRGLAFYLLSKHGDEYSDEQILAELARWKALWYPRDMVLKGMALAQENDGKINLADMAGRLDRSKLKNVDQSVLSQLTGMVGGC